MKLDSQEGAPRRTLLHDLTLAPSSAAAPFPSPSQPSGRPDTPFRSAAPAAPNASDVDSALSASTLTRATSASTASTSARPPRIKVPLRFRGAFRRRFPGRGAQRPDSEAGGGQQTRRRRPLRRRRPRPGQNATAGGRRWPARRPILRRPGARAEAGSAGEEKGTLSRNGSHPASTDARLGRRRRIKYNNSTGQIPGRRRRPISRRPRIRRPDNGESPAKSPTSEEPHTSQASGSDQIEDYYYDATKNDYEEYPDEYVYVDAVEEDLELPPEVFNWWLRHRFVEEVAEAVIPAPTPVPYVVQLRRTHEAKTYTRRNFTPVVMDIFDSDIFFPGVKPDSYSDIEDTGYRLTKVEQDAGKGGGGGPATEGERSSTGGPAGGTAGGYTPSHRGTTRYDVTTNSTSGADDVTTSTTDDVTASTTSKSDDVTTSTTSKATDVTPSTVSKADNITTSTTSEADDVTTSTTSKATDVTTSPTSKAIDVTPSTTSTADDVTPSPANQTTTVLDPFDDSDYIEVSFMGSSASPRCLPHVAVVVLVVALLLEHFHDVGDE
ncbi:hypothetical protein C7M84_014030 [Penaeus vannamei]|uniref:Uncharacterized protein n=1 Tax=Penaeus vannamei TaxID=6689 RepID=A0A423SUG2_PENVA|nr:hypothetical protein C7M84_014030 [Penaeus vannamei]